MLDSAQRMMLDSALKIMVFAITMSAFSSFSSGICAVLNLSDTEKAKLVRQCPISGLFQAYFRSISGLFVSYFGPILGLFCPSLCPSLYPSLCPSLCFRLFQASYFRLFQGSAAV